MCKLIVKDLCKTYVVNKIQNNVLRNVSFSVEEGDMVAVMGPSGSGKSTLLYTVSGMDRMTAGSVEFFGKDISGLSDNEMSDLRINEMGFIFQQMHMLGNLNIMDNIILPAYQSYKEKDRRVINAKAEKLMKKLQIIDIAGNDINEVSGGQMQRACICRSLINNPKMIFADEPTGALNQQSSKEVMRILNSFNTEENTTIMLVTHDLKVAARCDRILYIEDGNIRGECALGKYTSETKRDRERKVNNWLTELGW